MYGMWNSLQLISVQYFVNFEEIYWSISSYHLVRLRFMNRLARLEIGVSIFKLIHFFICLFLLIWTSLARIDISEEESESHWQRNDYKSFSPSTDWDSVDFTKAPAIQELPVTSVVCEPENHQVVELDKDGNLRLRGTTSLTLINNYE